VSKAGPARAATSPAGSAGFTLLELLVVLVLVAGALALVPGLIAGRSPPVLDGSAREIAGVLREARSRAIFLGRDQRVTLDLDARRLIDARGRETALPEGLGLALLTATAELEGDGRGAIRFFPDGGSTGGRVRLVQDGREIAVVVDWLTGRVAIDAR
jgi:general secretion pathway protein H